MNSRHTDCCDEDEDLVKWSSALSIKVGVQKHHLAEWSSISDVGATPQAQLITERCRCNYHMLKATIVALSTCSVKPPTAVYTYVCNQGVSSNPAVNYWVLFQCDGDYVIDLSHVWCQLGAYLNVVFFDHIVVCHMFGANFNLEVSV